MNSNERRFTAKEAVLLAVSLVVLLINPDELIGRIAVLAASALLLMYAVWVSGWGIPTNSFVTLNSGEGDFPDSTETFVRKLLPYVSIAAVFIVFGLVRWPSKPVGYSGDAVVTDIGSSHIEYHPTPKGIQPNSTDAQQQGTPSKQIIGHATGTQSKTPMRPLPPNPPTVTITQIQ